MHVLKDTRPRGCEGEDRVAFSSVVEVIMRLRLMQFLGCGDEYSKLSEGSGNRKNVFRDGWYLED